MGEQSSIKIYRPGDKYRARRCRFYDLTGTVFVSNRNMTNEFLKIDEREVRLKYPCFSQNNKKEVLGRINKIDPFSYT